MSDGTWWPNRCCGCGAELDLMHRCKHEPKDWVKEHNADGNVRVRPQSSELSAVALDVDPEVERLRAECDGMEAWRDEYKRRLILAAEALRNANDRIAALERSLADAVRVGEESAASAHRANADALESAKRIAALEAELEKSRGAGARVFDDANLAIGRLADENAVLRASLQKAREALTEASRSFRQTHINHCHIYEPYGRHAPECLLGDAEDCDEALCAIDAARLPAPPALEVGDPVPPEPLYPCAKCGKGRTKAEGGTVFRLCDGCWEEGPTKSAKPEGGEVAP